MNREDVVIGRWWDPNDRWARIAEVWPATDRRIGYPSKWDEKPDSITQKDLPRRKP